MLAASTATTLRATVFSWISVLLLPLVLALTIPNILLAQSSPTGGAVTYSDVGSTRTYIHTFTTSGTFTIPTGFSTIDGYDYLIVGGGGGGGDRESDEYAGGGGGGGTVVTADNVTLSGVVSVTVGSGGAANESGSTSRFGTASAAGGAPGAATNSSSGGSGGASGTLPGGNGGSNTGDSWDAYGGGGGAGSGGFGFDATAVDGGQLCNAMNGGAGGSGTSTAISGVSTFYGGGGGGGTSVIPYSTDLAPGGTGGGGTGSRVLVCTSTTLEIDAASGLTNSGGGGGGGGRRGAYATDAGAGGSGIVIVRYEVLLAPTITDVSSTLMGHFKAGSTVAVDVKFDQNVTVIGTPLLELETGTTNRTANFTSAVGADTLRFSYTVQIGDTASDLDYASSAALTLNGGTIKNGAGVDATLTLPAPGAAGSLAANSAIVIDTTAPVVTDGGISISGASGTGGAFKVGNIVTATWQTSGGDGDTNITGSLGSVTVDFSAFGGGSAVAASLSGSAWEATYQIVANTSTSGSNLNVSVTATDEAGNPTTTADTTNATVDAVLPVVTAANISLSGASGTGGTFKIGDAVTATWDDTSSGDNNGDVASVSVDFTEFGGGAVAATNSSGTWTATYTITSGSIDLANRNVTVIATDKAGNSNDDSGTDNVVVDNIDPTVVDGNIAVSGANGPAGAFKVGDTVIVAWTANNIDTVETVEVDFSAFGGPVATTATESSGVWTATYKLLAGSLFSSSLQVSVTAYDDAGNDLSTTKATVYTANTIVPTVEVTGPTEIVTEQFTVNIEFSEAVSNDLIASEIRVENGAVASVAAVSGSATKFTASIDPILGNTVLVQVLADAVANTAGGNPNTASNEFTVFAGNVETAFEEYRENIRQVIVDDAERSLRSGMSTNRRMVQGARTRFMVSQEQQAACSENEEATSTDETCVDFASRNNVAFNVDGTAQVSGTTLSTNGTFFGQTENFDGTSRRLVFGDFDVQHDGDTGSSTATITGRVAWEWMTSDTTMLGYFIGGELAHSSIAGAFDGDQDRLGVTVGGYGVHQLSEQLYADGYFSLGAGGNNLEMANDVLALTSHYTTQMATIGGALSGVYEYGQFDLRPELAFSYGKTWIGEVDFTGRAYGLVDDTLSLDVGNVSIANLTLRPEVVWALDGDTVAESNSHVSFAPRLICEQVKTVGTTEDCGGGAEFGLSSQSGDGLSKAEFRVIMDRVGNSTRSSFAFNLEHQF